MKKCLMPITKMASCPNKGSPLWHKEHTLVNFSTPSEIDQTVLSSSEKATYVMKAFILPSSADMGLECILFP